MCVYTGIGSLGGSIWRSLSTTLLKPLQIQSQDWAVLLVALLHLTVALLAISLHLHLNDKLLNSSKAKRHAFRRVTNFPPMLLGYLWMMCNYRSLTFLCPWYLNNHWVKARIYLSFKIKKNFFFFKKELSTQNCLLFLTSRFEKCWFHQLPGNKSVEAKPGFRGFLNISLPWTYI